jgi:hypothetical protein
MGMKRNYELNEFNESGNENFAAKAADLYECAMTNHHSYPFATKLQNSICREFPTFV